MIAEVAQAMGMYTPPSGTDRVVMKPVLTEVVTEQPEAAEGPAIKLTVHALVVSKQEGERLGFHEFHKVQPDGTTEVQLRYASDMNHLMNRPPSAQFEVTVPNGKKETVSLPASAGFRQGKIEIMPRLNADRTVTLSVDLKDVVLAACPETTSIGVSLNMSFGDAIVLARAITGDRGVLYLISPEYVGTFEQMAKAQEVATLEQRRQQNQAATEELRKRVATEAEREALQKRLQDLDQQRDQIMDQLHALGCNEITKMYKLQFLTPQFLQFQLGLS